MNWINIGSAAPDLYFPLVIFYSFLADIKRNTITNWFVGMSKDLFSEGSFGINSVFCRHGLFRLVNQRDIVSGAFSYSSAGHIHLFMYLQHTVCGACYTFFSFARSFCNHLDNFYLLVVYGDDCSRAVLDIQ